MGVFPMSEEIRRCCLTCSFFPGFNEEHELDAACKDYKPLDIDDIDEITRDGILIKLYGVEYLRNYYDDEEFDELYGWQVGIEGSQSKTGSRCPEDDGPQIVNETPYVDENGLRVCEFFLDGQSGEL